MRTKQFFALAMSVFVFANCAQKEIDAPVSENVAVVSAKVENYETRSNSTDGGYFTWTSGDRIGIHTENGFIIGDLESGAGSADGSFRYSYSGTAPVVTGYAVYPYNETHRISEGTLSYHIPSTFDLGANMTNTNAAMLAVPSDDAWGGNVSDNKISYSFSHLAGVMRFVFRNAPQGADKFTLSLGGKKINGTFSVSLEESEPSITTGDAASGEDVTTLTFSDLTSAQDLTLFVPVPVGEYTGISAALYDGETKLGEWGAATAQNQVGRRDLKLMAPIIFTSAGGVIENDADVANETALQEAVQKTGKVTLTEGFELEGKVSIPENTEVVIDLNGNSLENGSFALAEGAKLSIINNKESVAVRSGSSTATIKSEGDIITAAKDAVITVGEGVSLESTANCCIFVPRGAENVTVNTAGDLLTSGGTYAAVYVNGGVLSGTINITGGSVEHVSNTAVYVAGNVNLNISDGNIKGITAVEVRGGQLKVTGGTLIATGDPFGADSNGNGSTSVGAAVAVCQHTTDYTVGAAISNGIFEGVRALYEEDLENETNTDRISLSVTGGTFNGEVYSENCTAFITGGTYSSPSAFDYLAEGADVSLGASMTLEKSLTFTKTATVNLNTFDITCDKSDVFVVTGGTLTIDGTGTVWGSSDNSSSSCAVWAKENGNVVIKNGTYKVGDDESGKASGNWRNDCIYAKENGHITIEGGEFMYTGTNEIGHTFLLNCKDADYREGKCSIVVKGGTFHNFNPGSSNGENPVADYVAEGYKSTAADGDTYVVTAE